jgi:hypothetical protein
MLSWRGAGFVIKGGDWWQSWSNGYESWSVAGTLGSAAWVGIVTFGTL